MASLPLYFDIQFFANESVVAASHLLYTYENGTTTPKATYTDAAGGTPNSNPIELNSAGRCALWLLPSAYSFELRTAAGVLVKRYDDVEPSAGLGSLAGLTATTGGALVGFDKDTDYGGTPGDPSNVARAIKEVLGEKVFTVYVATTGSDSNDGSVSAPFATVQKAFNTLMSIGTLGGSRRISVAAGTYSSVSARTARLGQAFPSETVPNTNYQTGGSTSANHIIIEGPDVGYDPSSLPEPVPTAIFDGGGAATVGMTFVGVKVLVKNIKFLDYSGSSASCGISADSSWLRTENVHAENCYYGISSARGRVEVKGGVLKDCTGAGIRSIFLNKHEIGNQNAGAAGQGPFFRNCTFGLFAQECATGHSDYATYEDCDDGIRVTVVSRVNYSGSDFKRNGRGVRADANCVIVADGTETFNDGTADANDENVVLQTGAIDVSRDPYANSALATNYNSAADITGTATSTAILTRTIKRGRFCPNLSSIRKPVHISGEAYGTVSGTADIKQLKIRLGSTILASASIPSTYTGAWYAQWKVTFTDSNVQTAVMSVLLHDPSASGSTSLLSVDSVGTEDIAAADVALTFEGQLGSAVADHIVCPAGAAHFEVWG